MKPSPEVTQLNTDHHVSKVVAQINSHLERNIHIGLAAYMTNTDHTDQTTAGLSDR